jgi:acetyl-CoA synthetase
VHVFEPPVTQMLCLWMVQASNAEDTHWLMSHASYKPVMEYCGGTEVAGAFCSGTLLHPSIPAAFATCTLGMELHLLDENGRVSASMSEHRPARGEVTVQAPALGSSSWLLNRDHFQVYFAGMPCVDVCGNVCMPVRRHGDEFEVITGLGYFRAHGRCDDTMNLGGVKVSCSVNPVLVPLQE